MSVVDWHCKIGRVRLKGSRIITSRLPRLTIEKAQKLRDELSRAAVGRGRG